MLLFLFDWGEKFDQQANSCCRVVQHAPPHPPSPTSVHERMFVNVEASKPSNRSLSLKERNLITVDIYQTKAFVLPAAKIRAQRESSLQYDVIC